MGAGKGKTKRTQTTKTKTARRTLPKVNYDENKWEEFVHNSELENINFFKYYLGKNFSTHKSATWTIPNWEQAFNEFFKDIIEIGVTKIPQPYTTDNFQITMHPTGNSYEMIIRLKGQPQPHGFIGQIGNTMGFDKDTTMNDKETSRAVDYITIALSELLQKLPKDNNNH